MSQQVDHAAGVLISGGLDSAILCVELARDFPPVVPIYIRSGLWWEGAELSALRRFLGAVKREGLHALVVLDEPIADVYGAHWSTSGASVPGSDTPDEAVYLPGRNILLNRVIAYWVAGQLKANPPSYYPLKTARRHKS